MANEIFVDTSGFYAIVVKADDQHHAARRILRDAQRRKRQFITTDYILDETATLLKARSLKHLLTPFLSTLDASPSISRRVDRLGALPRGQEVLPEAWRPKMVIH
jgi:predicted nucleic acid-binding protein